MLPPLSFPVFLLLPLELWPVPTLLTIGSVWLMFSALIPSKPDGPAIGSRLVLIRAVQRLAVPYLARPCYNKSFDNTVNVYNSCAQCRNRSTIWNVGAWVWRERYNFSKLKKAFSVESRLFTIRIGSGMHLEMFTQRFTSYSVLSFYYFHTFLPKAPVNFNSF